MFSTMFSCPVCARLISDHVCPHCGFTEADGFCLDDDDERVLNAGKSVHNAALREIHSTKQVYTATLNELNELMNEHHALTVEFNEIYDKYLQLQAAYTYLKKSYDSLCSTFLSSEHVSGKAAAQNNANDAESSSGTNSFGHNGRDFYIISNSTLREYRGSISVVEIPENITQLQHAFIDNKTVTAVLIHDGVKHISYRTFSGCANLETVVLPTYINKIDTGTFEYCKKLCNISIPPYVIEIGAGAFRQCKRLVTLSIPTSVQRIGAYAFDGCTNLKDLYLTANVQDIGPEAFHNCTQLTIHAPLGSYAESYANRMGFAFSST